MYRLFVAIDPPDEIKQSLAAICFGLPGAKWVDVSQMHITLKFIGDVDGLVFRETSEALEAVAVEPFEVAVGSLGFFPPRGEPKLLWAGVAGNDRLVQLRNKVEAVLAQAGLKRETRKFAPHVRLAKVKDTPPAKLAGFLTESALFKLPPFKVTEFFLYSSFLSSEKAIHQVEAAYPLNGSRKAET